MAKFDGYYSTNPIHNHNMQQKRQKRPNEDAQCFRTRLQQRLALDLERMDARIEALQALQTCSKRRLLSRLRMQRLDRAFQLSCLTVDAEVNRARSSWRLVAACDPAGENVCRAKVSEE